MSKEDFGDKNHAPSSIAEDALEPPFRYVVKRALSGLKVGQSAHFCSQKLQNRVPDRAAVTLFISCQERIWKRGYNHFYTVVQRH